MRSRRGRDRAGRQAAPPARCRSRGKRAVNRPVPTREQRLFPKSLQGSPRWSAPGCRCAASPSRRRASTTRTPARSATLEPRADDDRGVAVRVPARPRGARRRRPGADARVVGVRPAREGERLRRDRPRRGRHGVPDRHARSGHAGRRVPRPRDRAGRRRQPEGDLRLPRRVRVAARTVARFDAARIIPKRGPGSRGRSSSSEDALRASWRGASPLGGTVPARVQVVANEYSFSLSRTTLKPGTAVIELANFGQDPHDLRAAAGRCSSHRGHQGRRSGHRAELTVKLAAGAILVLVLRRRPRARGMRATLDRPR